MKKKILVVDDHKENIKLLGSILREAGYEIGFATDGLQAIKVLNANNDFKLILMDIKMPELNGLDACKKIKQNPATKDIPVIFLTAKNEKKDIIEGFNAGGADYITKPFHALELLSRVKTHIQLKSKTDELLKTAESLKQSNATKDKFFSIISHDLRNPVSVLTSTQNMMEAEINKSGNEKLSDICLHARIAIEGITGTLDNLLEWARSQVGDIAYSPMDIFLDSLIYDILSLLKPAALRKKITIDHAIDPELFIVSDKNMLETMIRNIVSNAIKFTPVGGKISISAVQEPKETIIQIKDNGIGMSESKADKLFMNNGIASLPGTDGELGSGLGLQICQEFAEKINGKLWVESKQNIGSTFYISIPDI